MRRWLKKSTEQRGVVIPPDDRDDLCKILKSSENAMLDDGGEIKRIFWEQQLKALQAKDSRRIRWQPLVIKICLHLHYKSSSAYQSLRNSGVLILPSERTLFDYSHWCKSGAGFLDDVAVQLQQEANIKEEKDTYVVLSFDEMKIRENLVFDKNNFSLVGFVDIGDISNSLRQFEQQFRQNSAPPINDVATHMLSFFVRGIFSSLKFPFAHFPTKGATAKELLPLVWQAVSRLEARIQSNGDHLRRSSNQSKVH